ncbi:hypothetical protein GYMLUDRAFT_407432 [Collybiopsis luxurians FD-317 M1]|uniref:Uncharacterized protein n=1 Tax=Collybiopsis luxurians FD-317 M1 TaxID=944289 RepID=A0A0D0C8I2_9AGAR|nr:hypothetical protein GYMLUDRAFT_407432 [Collybiopsis luxurians FD-317 M1]
MTRTSLVAPTLVVWKMLWYMSVHGPGSFLYFTVSGVLGSAFHLFAILELHSVQCLSVIYPYALPVPLQRTTGITATRNRSSFLVPWTTAKRRNGEGIHRKVGQEKDDGIEDGRHLPESITALINTTVDSRRNLTLYLLSISLQRSATYDHGLEQTRGPECAQTAYKEKRIPV